MASIVIGIEQQHVPAFNEMLENTDLVEVVSEVKSSYQRIPTVLFTLDAGPGNAIHYFYLGQAWADALRKKGGPQGG